MALTKIFINYISHESHVKHHKDRFPKCISNAGADPGFSNRGGAKDCVHAGRSLLWQGSRLTCLRALEFCMHWFCIAFENGCVSPPPPPRRKWLLFVSSFCGEAENFFLADDFVWVFVLLVSSFCGEARKFFLAHDLVWVFVLLVSSKCLCSPPSPGPKIHESAHECNHVYSTWEIYLFKFELMNYA